jgi:hypothetical protein
MATDQNGELEQKATKLKKGGNPKARRIAREELRRLGWVEAGLSRRPKNDSAKLALAARVKLGTSKSANARLHARMKNPARDKNAK